MNAVTELKRSREMLELKPAFGMSQSDAAIASSVLAGIQGLAASSLMIWSFSLSPALGQQDLVCSEQPILMIACPEDTSVCWFNVEQRLATNLVLPGSPSDLAISSKGTAYVTCGGETDEIVVLDPASRKILARVSSGHGSTAPVLNPDESRLYVCNRFDNDVTVFDAASLRQIARIPVVREPVAADISRDGRHLLVANHLPAGRANVDNIAAVISVIDTKELKPLKQIRLPNGSGQLKDLRVSPDGKYAAVTHLVASHFRATTKLQSAWINGNALTIIDMNALESLGTILLDEPGAGAANPWGLAWSSDGRTLVVTHAGTHEVSLIDFPQLLEAIQNPAGDPDGPPVLTSEALYEGLAETLPFLVGARQRIKLPPGDLGPRSVEVVGDKAYVLNYFSQTLSILNLSDPGAPVESVPLHEETASGTNTARVTNSRAAVLAGMSQERRGEFYFHDASICFQGWQSCASCHPGGARVDGLNWDLLNDGIGNPKNTKSLLLAFQTPPAMSLGVRGTAEAAVRAGLRHILFTQPRDDIVRDISAYLKSLKPEPSPYLVDGQLSESARRGEKIFARAGCAECIRRPCSPTSSATTSAPAPPTMTPATVSTSPP